MKLAEFLQEYFTEIYIHKRNVEHIINGNELKLIEDSISSCDEFETVSSLFILENPTFEYKNRVFHAQNVRFDGQNFRGAILLHSIFLSPIIVDAMDLVPISNDCWQVSPLIPIYSREFQILSKNIEKKEIELLRTVSKEEYEASINIEVEKFKNVLKALVFNQKSKDLTRKKSKRHIIIRYAQLDAEIGEPQNITLDFD